MTKSSSNPAIPSAVLRSIVGLIAIVGVCIAPMSFGKDDDSRRLATARAPSLPLYFEENRGQTDPGVHFVNRSGDTTTFFRSGDVVMRLASETGPAVVQMRFLEVSDAVAVEGEDLLPGKSSYFRGNDPAQWVTHAPHFSTLRYNDIYPGIDAVFQGHEGELRYDFHLAPGVDPGQIKLAFDGVSGLSLADNGDLVLATGAGDIIHRAPVVYQDVDGGRVHIDAGFEFGEDRAVLFAVADFDRTRPLVIDPVISYSTFLGGAGADSGRAVRVDPTDRTIVVTGWTTSLDFPLAGAVQTTHGNGGGAFPNGWFPNPNGTDATYLWDQSFGRTDSYSVKITASTRPAGTLNNPGWRYTDPIFIDVSKTHTASVWVYSADGGIGHVPAIQFFDGFGTLIGTIGATGPSGFTQPANTWVQRSFTFTPAQIPDGTFFVNFLVVQDIDSTMPTPTSVSFDDVELKEAGSDLNLLFINNSFGEAVFRDVFVSKLTADGSGLIFSTYLGGNGAEIPQNVELDSLGNIIVGGRTASTNFPTANAVDATYAGPVEDGFLAKLTPDGSSLIFSTYVGGNDVFHPFEEIRGIVTDAANNIFVIGNTSDPDFVTTDLVNATPCVAAAQPRSADVFIREYSPSGALLFSTCFGGSSRDAGRNLAFDSSGNLFATGWTESSDFPTTAGVVQSVFAGRSSGFGLITDGWVAKLDITASPPTILASTYLGGDGYEALEGLGVDGFDNVVVSGTTNATDYPTTPGAFQTVYGGSPPDSEQGDGVITKLSPDLTSFGFSTFLGGSGDDFAWGLKMDIEDRPYVTGYTTSPDFPVVAALQGNLSGPIDVMVAQMTADGSALDFSTYLGGSGSDDSTNGITVLNPGNVFVTGATNSADFPLLNPVQGSIASGFDAFITNISTPITVPASDCTAAAGGCNPTGGQQIVLPEGFVVPPDATITQTAVPQVDPRVVNGRCDGVTPLSLFDGDLIIPGTPVRWRRRFHGTGHRDNQHRYPRRNCPEHRVPRGVLASGARLRAADRHRPSAPGRHGLADDGQECPPRGSRDRSHSRLRYLPQQDAVNVLLCTWHVHRFRPRPEPTPGCRYPGIREPAPAEDRCTDCRHDFRRAGTEERRPGQATDHG